MAEFDPYRDLLNIRASDDKPDHYALLGLTQFESDPAKIDEAADARMEMLQEMSISQHMDAAQQLLNEVSKARRVLLDEGKRAAYDEELRNPKPIATSAPAISVSKQQSARSSATAKKGTKRRSNSRSAAKATKKSGTPMMPIGITAAVVVVLAIVYFAFGGGGGGSGNVIVEWAMSERGNAEVLLDGKRIEITDTNPVYLNVPAKGRSRLTFRRDGYQDIQKTVSSPKGRVRMKLNWVKER